MLYFKDMLQAMSSFFPHNVATMGHFFLVKPTLNFSGVFGRHFTLCNFQMHTKLCPINDETLPIINKSKHPKKRGNIKKKKKDPHPKKQKQNHQ